MSFKNLVSSEKTGQIEEKYRIDYNTGDGRELESCYENSFFQWILKNGDYILQIEIGDFIDNRKISELKKCREMEEYLLEIENSIAVSEIYKRIIEILNFSPEDISKCNLIYINYVCNDKLLGRIKLKKGINCEYAVIENEILYHIINNGNWNVKSTNIEINYFKENDGYVFSISGSESTLTKINIANVLKDVKEIIFKLKKELNI